MPETSAPTGNATVPAVHQRVSLAWRELRRGASMSAMREVVLGTGPGALEPGELDTMDLLSQEESWRMGDLARALRVDPSTATRAVQRLTRAGLAERRSCSEDGRVAYVALTATGRARHRIAVEQRRAVLERMFEHFDETEAEQLADLLERFVAAFDEAVGHQLHPEQPS